MGECTDCCSGGPKLIFACSGAADVGELADKVARKMTADGTGKMFCMAGIGGKVKPIMDTTRAASKILALDGCQLDCVKNSLQNAGFTDFEHLRVTDCGLQKGGTDITDENIAKIAEKAEKLIS